MSEGLEVIHRNVVTVNENLSVLSEGIGRLRDDLNHVSQQVDVDIVALQQRSNPAEILLLSWQLPFHCASRQTDHQVCCFVPR